jgi:hypothetical protein
LGKHRGSTATATSATRTSHPKHKPNPQPITKAQTLSREHAK